LLALIEERSQTEFRPTLPWSNFAMNWSPLRQYFLVVLTIFSGLGLSCHGATGRPLSKQAFEDQPELAAEIAGIERARARLGGCLPASGVTTKEQLSIRNVERLTNSTRIDLVVWADEQPVDLQLPLYLSSRGRWLLGDDQRVYLVDQECRQYGLHDVEFLQTRQTPGIVRISAHQAITGTLIFPPLGPRARFGALIFGHRILRILLPDPPPATAQPTP
jgi:hypothetical protein